MRKIIVSILLIPFFAVAQTYTKQLQEFDNYVKQGMKDWELPGLSVVIVKNNQVLLSKGYGVRELGTTNAVDDKTLFSIGSTTKAMTAVCMGILVDEGKVNWNDPVIKHLPDFQLYDPSVTRELKIRDLFTHNSGVGNADFLWSVMNVSSDEILRKMKQVEPSYSLRSSFIYQNIFYLAAGKVIERVSGMPWEKFIKAKIFEPLGMTRTVPLLKELTDPNQTKPHYKVNNVIKPIENTSADKVGPAGSVYSCADDISKWVMAMLDSSKYKNGRLLKPQTWVEMFKPQVIVPPGQFYPTQQLTKPNWMTYGLGWFQHDYKGKKVNFHTGSLAGAIALHAQLPDEKLGYFFLGNFDHAELRHALMYKTFDLFALGGTRDWSAEFKKLYDGVNNQIKKQEDETIAKRVTGTTPSHGLENFAGTYMDELYGEAKVELNGNALNFTINNFVKAKSEHWHYDTFRIAYEKDWYGTGFTAFILNDLGKVSELNFEGMVFKKKE